MWSTSRSTWTLRSPARRVAPSREAAHIEAQLAALHRCTDA
jgi:hypothetical protein